MNPLPRGWQHLPLSVLCEPVVKMDPVSIGRPSIKYVDIGSVDGEHQRLTAVAVLESASAPSRARQVLRGGDTVFSTVRPYLRKVAYIDHSLDGEFASTGFTVLRPSERLDPRYLFHYCTSHEFLEQVLPHQRGVSYPAVRDRDVLRCLVPIPPLQTQRRIVEILEGHLSRLEAATGYLYAASQRLPGLTTSWMDRNIEGKGDFTPLSEIVLTAKTGWDRARRFSVEPPAGYQYLKMHNVHPDGDLDLSSTTHVSGLESEADRYRVEIGDVLFNNRNSRELVGKTAVADHRIAGWTYNNNFVRLRLKPSVNPRFAALQMSSHAFRRRITGSISASTNVAAIYTRDLLRQRIWVPNMEIQIGLIERHEEIASASRRMRRSIASASSHMLSLQRRLLAAAFAGALAGPTADTTRGFLGG